MQKVHFWMHFFFWHDHQSKSLKNSLILKSKRAFLKITIFSNQSINFLAKSAQSWPAQSSQINFLCGNVILEFHLENAKKGQTKLKYKCILISSSCETLMPRCVCDLNSSSSSLNRFSSITIKPMGLNFKGACRRPVRITTPKQRCVSEDGSNRRLSPMWQIADLTWMRKSKEDMPWRKRPLWMIGLHQDSEKF